MGVVGLKRRSKTGTCYCAVPLYAIDTCAIGIYAILMHSLQTVVELDTFLKRAKAIMSDDERAGIVSFLAANPEAGVSLGGGLRKVRVPRSGGG